MCIGIIRDVSQKILIWYWILDNHLIYEKKDLAIKNIVQLSNSTDNRSNREISKKIGTKKKHTIRIKAVEISSKWITEDKWIKKKQTGYLPLRELIAKMGQTGHEMYQKISGSYVLIGKKCDWFTAICCIGHVT